MSVVEIKSKIGIEELLGELRQLDVATLDYLVTSLQQEQVARKQPRSSKMAAAQFWQLISKIDWSCPNDTAKLKSLVDSLAELAIPKIYQFSEHLAEVLHQLDGPEYLQALEKDELGYSADTFLYARCFAVAKGQVFYENVLSKRTPLPADYLEQLLSVASKAYQQKTGETYTYTPSTIYESFFNQKLWGEAAIVL